MDKIEKPVEIEVNYPTFNDLREIKAWNKAIEQSDKYWEQEMKPYKDKLEELQSRDCISLHTEQQICEYKDREWEQKLSVENIEKVLDIAYLKYHDCRSKFFTLEEKMLIKDLAEAIHKLISV